MTDTILNLVRGLTRPLALWALTAAIITAVFVGLLPAEALLGTAGPVIGWWFKERSDRHTDGMP